MRAKMLLICCIVALAYLFSGCSKRADQPVTGQESRQSQATEKSESKSLGEKGSITETGEYSADMVNTVAGRTTTSRIWVKDGKMRMETDTPQKAVTIFRPDKKASYMLDETAKTYMEIKTDPTQFAGTAAEEELAKLGERKHVGTETVNGVQCDKYTFTFHDKSMGTQDQWIGKKFKAMVKMEQKGPYPMIIEQKNFKEGRVSDTLFEIPDGYKKIEIPQMPQ